MKIGKVSAEKVGSALAQTGGLVAGMLVSNGVSKAIPLDNSLASKGIVLGVGLAALTLVSGQDTGTKIVRSIGAGIAGQQAKEIIKEVATPHLPDVKFIKDSFEALDQPASSSTANAMGALNRSLAARRSMGNPVFKLGNAQPQTSSFVIG